MPLYRYVGGTNAHVLPVPMMNVLNGGAHADNNVDLQEFMIVPVGAVSFAEGAALGRRDVPRAEGAAERARPVDRRRRRGRLRARPAVERGSAEAARRSDRAARATSPATRSRSRSTPPSTEFYDDGMYELARREAAVSRRPRWSATSPTLCDRYPIVSIEDGMAEDDWDGWAALTERARRPGAARRRRPVRHQLRAPRRAASTRGVANSILVKVNQIGTLTETLDTVTLALTSGYTAVMSHRSGETEDATIADLAVATELRADQGRRARPQRPRREVQPAAAHRGGPRRSRATRRTAFARTSTTTIRSRRADARTATRSTTSSERDRAAMRAGTRPRASRAGRPTGSRSVARVVAIMFLFVFPTRSYLAQQRQVGDAAHDGRRC